jgi:hypothetical protein
MSSRDLARHNARARGKLLFVSMHLLGVIEAVVCDLDYAYKEY